MACCPRRAPLPSPASICVNNSFIQVMGSVLSRSGRVPGKVCLPPSKHLAAPAHQMFPQSVTPTRSRLVRRQGGRHVHTPVPSCSLDVEVWRPQGLCPELLCRAASATPGCARASANQIWDTQTPRPPNQEARVGLLHSSPCCQI